MYTICTLYHTLCTLYHTVYIQCTVCNTPCTMILSADIFCILLKQYMQWKVKCQRWKLCNMKMKCSLANTSTAIWITVRSALLYSVLYYTVCFTVQCAFKAQCALWLQPINWGRTHIAAPWPHKRERSPFSFLQLHNCYRQLYKFSLVEGGMK